MLKVIRLVRIDRRLLAENVGISWANSLKNYSTNQWFHFCVQLTISLILKKTYYC